MLLLPYIIFFALGLIIGSFLNVVICRINTSKSLRGRSACMSCESKLCWYELIPVFSFLALSGRCRSCKSKISLQYPLVELGSGVVFVALFCKFQNLFFADPAVFALTYLYYAVAFSILLVIVGYDLRHMIIPDQLSLAFGVLAFFGLFFVNGGVFSLQFQMPNTLEFFSGIFIATPFALLWLASRGAWMGLGDAKLALGLGWFLGLAFALSALVLSFWVGTIIGLGLIFFARGYGLKSQIPFAPYLVLGSFIAFIFELNLFQIYF